MDAMGALDASAERIVELVGRVGPEQWDNPTPCTEWNVRTLVGHLIVGMQGYCDLLEGASAAEYLSMFERQSVAVGTDPVAACESAVRSARAASVQPGALERTVHHLIGDIPGSRLLRMRIAGSVVHDWDRQLLSARPQGWMSSSSSSSTGTMRQEPKAAPCTPPAGSRRQPGHCPKMRLHCSGLSISPAADWPSRGRRASNPGHNT